MSKGTYTNSELVDTLILDLNNLPKALCNGQYIQACGIVSQMGQKLLNLREGIKNDLAGKDATIEQLKETIRNMGQEVVDCTPEELLADQSGKAGVERGTV